MLKKAYKNKKNTGMSTHTHTHTEALVACWDSLSLSVGESAQRESDTVCVFVV